MSDEPIRSGEFNQAMEMIRSSLARLEKGQDFLTTEQTKLYDMHRDYLLSQNERSYEAGKTAGMIKALEDRTKTLEINEKANITHKRQLTIGVIVTCLASILSIVVTYFPKR